MMTQARTQPTAPAFPGIVTATATRSFHAFPFADR